MLSKLVYHLVSFLYGGTLINFCLSKFGRTLCALVLGCVACFGFAPYELWIVTMGAMVLLMILLSGLKSKGAVFYTSYIFFVSYLCASAHWMNYVMHGFAQMPLPVCWLILILGMSLVAIQYAFFIMVAFIFARSKKEVFVFFFIPVAIGAADFTSTVLFSGLPWFNFGHTVFEGPFASFHPLLGVRGTSILMMLCSAAVAMAALRRFLFLPVAAIITFIGVMLAPITYTHEDKALDVAMVQGNIAQEIRLNSQTAAQSLGTYWDATRDLLGKHELVIWPEAALPFYLNDAIDVIKDLNLAASDKKSALVLGILRRNDNNRYNSLVALGDLGDKGVQIYDKRHLVPFGEFVPFDSILRPLGHVFDLPMSSFSPSQITPAPIEIKKTKLIPIICYEAIFPEDAQVMDSSDVGALLMISNNSWFGDTKGPLQLFNITRIRALELQKPMLHSTTNGVTALIDFNGKYQSAKRDEFQILEGSIKTRTGQTPYSKIGPWGALILMLILLALGIAKRLMKVDERAESFKNLVRP